MQGTEGQKGEHGQRGQGRGRCREGFPRNRRVCAKALWLTGSREAEGLTGQVLSDEAGKYRPASGRPSRVLRTTGSRDLLR